MPANSTIGIIGDFKKLKELGYYQSLYSVLKTFFSRIDKGFKSESDSTRDVFAYNGGLFKTDEILDSVIISDDVLLKHCKILADYDFQSQISVDILGRIFENSLTEIEELTSPPNPLSESARGNAKDSPRLAGEGQGERSRLSKRKKDGVFYTPEYITKYIVENTIGTLCEAKKTELNINDKAYTFDKKYSQKTVADLDRRLEEYRAWLLSLKILDPACGSGAFLNAALKFLRKEHTLIDYFWSKIHSGELNFTAIDNAILENNLYGVDINEDSVEITKLSLWLSTAQKNRKLTTLAGKIKCGNSLISDKNVAGEKAFDWKNEFPEVFGEKPFGASPFLQENGEKLFSASQLLQENGEKPNSASPLSQENRENLFSKSPLSQENGENLFSKSPLSQENGEKPFGASPFLQENGEKPFGASPFSQENGENPFSNGGFDVIIGNPPYVSAPNQMANAEMAKNREAMIQSGKYKTLYQKWDLYIPFIELGTQLNCENGITTMIVPFPLTNQLYAKVLRKMLVEEYDMFELVDLNGTKIFDNATVSNCIPFVKKARKSHADSILLTQNQKNKNGKSLDFPNPCGNSTWISKIDENLHISRAFEQTKNDLVQDEKNYVWNVTQEKRETNRHADMHVLGDFCYISVGMVLNADEKDSKGEFSKEDLISKSKDEIHCREYIEAKDVEKYKINRIRYLEYNTERVPNKIRRPTFRELYDAPKLVMNCLGTINSTVDFYVHFLHNHSIYCGILWKDLHGVENKSIASSIKKFSTMNRKDMEELSKAVDLRYLLGVMNSQYASVLLTNLRGDDYHIYPEHIRNIPIPSATPAQQKPIITLVDKILAAKKANPQADTSSLESQIDELVYDFYGLTGDEKDIIRGK